jgi:hypothetical protein
MTFPTPRWPVLLALALGSLAVPGATQEVFRESVFTYGAAPAEHFSELDPATTRDFKGGAMATKPRHVPKPLTIDLAQAVRAELSVEYWGGHNGTTGQRFQVNGQGWIDLPQPAGTPEVPQRYLRMLHGNNAVPVPLAHLRDGANQVQFAAGPQLKGNWGFYWIYDFTVRVFYNPSRPHPVGEIVAPHPGTTFGDSLVLEARASSPSGAIARVEFIGEYDDFDWDGDGVWREWQFTTHHGVLQHHLGTATAAPWRVTWDARWLPDQAQPIRVRARITDALGMSYLTPPVTLAGTQRAGRSVRMLMSADVPEGFSVRVGREKSCTIEVPADLSRATAARLVLSTWSGSTDDDSAHELRLNGEQLASHFGQFHHYAFSSLEVPVARLKPGTNTITIYSTYKGHALEINWPGPALLVEFTIPSR